MSVIMQSDTYCMVFICTSWKAWVLFLSSGFGLSGIAREFDGLWLLPQATTWSYS